MRTYYNKAKSLIVSSTAMDTYVLFVGNLGSAVLGFLFIFLVAKFISRDDFGVFSAALNLVVILTSISDLGITSGLVNFIAKADSENDEATSLKYQKAGLVIKISVVLLLSLIVILFAPYISKTLLASSDPLISVWVSLISFALFVPMYFPYVLQAKKKFMESMAVDNIYYLFRFLGLIPFIFFGGLTLYRAFSTALFGFVVSLILSFVFLKLRFLTSRPSKNIYLSLIKFSGWVGLNRIISAISGRLDLQMLAVLSTAYVTAGYSMASRISSIAIIFTSSYSAVLAPRFSSIGNKEKEKKYLIKSTLGAVPIALVTILSFIVIGPFIKYFFPDYIDVIIVYKYLIIALIPFIFTAPSVTAIIYAMNKPKYIGLYSFPQLAIVFGFNYFFIPLYGYMGPVYTLAISNTILAIYTWVIVIRYYYFTK
jgi:O-antigen/teichoic acid export membrane protein